MLTKRPFLVIYDASSLSLSGIRKVRELREEMTWQLTGQIFPSYILILMVTITSTIVLPSTSVICQYYTPIEDYAS